MALLRKLTIRTFRRCTHYNKQLRPMNISLLSRRHLDDNYTYSSGDAIVKQYAAKSETILSLSDIIHYTGTDEKMRDYGKFIWHEIPIRISHRVVELSSLPYNLSNTESIRELRALYTHSFHLFRMLESPDTPETEKLFIDQMIEHFNSLKSATVLLANALTQSELVIPECPFLNGFLDRFHTARIGTRLLTGQYITCKQQKASNTANKKVLGLIDFECSPKQILEAAVDDAQYLCENNYGRAPDINIQMTDKHLTFPYIPSDLHYMFFELMKNSMRAVCEKYNENQEDFWPPIECVIVASGESEDVCIKISDQGEGISKEDIEKIWYYSYTTIPQTQQPQMQTKAERQSEREAKSKSPMHGFGYGLPLSRLYTRYFGGDLKVISMDGYGTDAFIYLCWLKPDDVKPLRLAYY